jgi:hypothetical protein
MSSENLFEYDPEREPLCYTIVLNSVEYEGHHCEKESLYTSIIGNYISTKDLTPEQVGFIRNQNNSMMIRSYDLICNKIDISGKLYAENPKSLTKNFNTVEELIEAINKTTPSSLKEILKDLKNQRDELKVQLMDIEAKISRYMGLMAPQSSINWNND